MNTAIFNPNEPGVIDWLIGYNLTDASNKPQRHVIQIPLDGSPEVEWPTVSHAERELRLCKGSINRHIRDGGRSPANSKWRLKD